MTKTCSIIASAIAVLGFVSFAHAENNLSQPRGGARHIRSIQFWYETKGMLNGRAHVTAFGPH
jgi:hypothetical protein